MADPVQPFHSGPFKRISNVHWNTGDKIAVVEFSYFCQWHRPEFKMSGFHFTTDTPDVISTPIEYAKAGPVPPIPPRVHPITDAMMKKFYWFSIGDTFYRLTTDRVYQMKALWFFNLSLIKQKPPTGVAAADYTDFTFTINQPAGTQINQDGSIYWVWLSDFGTFEDNLADPQLRNVGGTAPGGGPFYIVVPTACASSSEAGFVSSVLQDNNPVDTYSVFTQSTLETFLDGLSWSTRISTYPKPPDKKRRDFPTDPPNTVDIDWDPDTESKFVAAASADTFGTPIEARAINYTVNFKTLAVTIT